MKVAIVHYHLQPGGVTRVIESTIQSWENNDFSSVEYVVLTGRPYSGKKLRKVEVVEGLDYADAEDSVHPATLKDNLERAALAALGGRPDIWHIHNHTLGKNPALTQAVALLAQSGARLFLQPHDFAEDGRPQNFKNLAGSQEVLYPTANQIHYAALNRRDQGFLQNLNQGLSSPVHLLANAIPPTPEKTLGKGSIRDIPDNLFLYPVRAVRRKNLGELALLSAAYPEIHFANSLGPTNPSFLSLYQEWVAFSSSHRLGLSYGLGEQTEASFPEMVNSAQSIINVSVAEGFGLGFLEPWTYGKSLCGRNIPEITSDFTDLGVNLQNLYDEIWIDPSMIDMSQLKQEVTQSLNSIYSDYNHPLPQHALQRAMIGLSSEKGIKFGCLNETLQRSIIKKILNSELASQSVRDQSRLCVLSPSKIESNRLAVKNNFSLQSYGQRVLEIYEALLSSEVEAVSFADGNGMLEQFLIPERLNLLRT